MPYLAKADSCANSSSIRKYLLDTNVQLGATYETSQSSTKLYEEGCKAGAAYVNARPDETGALVHQFGPNGRLPACLR